MYKYGRCEEAGMRIKTILFPTDFSNGARAAMDHAISLAKDYSAKLILIYVAQNVPVTEWDNLSPHYETELMDDLEKSAGIEMGKWVSEVSAKAGDVDQVIARGVPFVEIIKTAREKKADLIVIGTHGRTGIDHMLFGSTAEKVVRKSPCPVLTVRIPGKEFKLP
jgi:nucleotide-binding universal stress UspA family protein